MSQGQINLFIAATVLGGLGLWLLLPRGTRRGQWVGAVMALVSIGMLASQVTPMVDYLTGGVFWILAGITIAAAVGTITFRNAVHSAIWFGLMLLGTAGLFLVNGAQFLALATVVVYAGAILVTFLFVLMLANPRGHAFYDRISWESFLSAAAGAVMIGMLTMTLARVFTTGDQAVRPQVLYDRPALESEILSDQHVAHLGAQLFSRHLIAVEVAGTLLLVALVAAVAIIVQDRPKKFVGGSQR
jgi:NADH-quinone oxidoreductase subunit J